MSEMFSSCEKTSRERPKSAPYLRLKTVKGDPLTLKKSQKKSYIVIFEQCHSAGNCERGTLREFLTSIMLQNIDTDEGGTL